MNATRLTAMWQFIKASPNRVAFHSNTLLPSSRPLVWFLSLSLLTAPWVQLATPMMAQADNNTIQGDVRITVDPTQIKEDVEVPNGSMIVNMAFRDIPVKDALMALGKAGGFNIAADDSVEGNISVDLNNVTINDALETIKSYANLTCAVSGNTVMVAASESARGDQFNRMASKIIPIKYANATLLADIINRALYDPEGANAAAASSGTMKRVVSADFFANSILVVGSQSDVKITQEMVSALDKPREMKTWRLSHAQASQVASLLAATVFNDGPIPAVIVGGQSGGGSSGGGGGGAQLQQQLGFLPSNARVNSDTIVEGQGSAAATAQGGSGTGQTGTVVNSQTLRSLGKVSENAQISSAGPIIIPDTRMNTVTLLATAAQIELAEAILPTLDRKVPQVVLEASLVELSETASKQLGFNLSGRGERSNHFSYGSNNNQGPFGDPNNAFSQAVGLPTSVTSPLESVMQFTSRPDITNGVGWVYQLNALISQNKAKLLAHPTILASHENESIISIVDEIVKSVTVTIDTGTAGPPTITSQANIGEAGISLNILPKIAPNGTVTLRVRPTVTTVRDVTTDAFGNVITLLSKRDVLAQQVTLKDGESFFIGGLIQESDNDVSAKIPLLGDLPIVGALARQSNRGKSRTELVIMITPHIVNDDDVAATRPYGPVIPAANSTGGEPVSQMVPKPVLPPLQPLTPVPHGAPDAPMLRGDSETVKQAYQPSKSVQEALDESRTPVLMQAVSEGEARGNQKVPSGAQSGPTADDIQDAIKHAKPMKLPKLKSGGLFHRRPHIGR